MADTTLPPQRGYHLRQRATHAHFGSWGVGGVFAIALSASALAGCNPGSGQQARSDASQAANNAGAALNDAAVDTKDTVQDLAAAAKPTVDQAAQDAKTGVDKLAVAAGRATAKAGVTLEKAGERHERRDDANDSGD